MPGAERRSGRSHRLAAVAAALVTLVAGGIHGAPSAQAANAIDFAAGSIISDSVFYDGAAMSVSQIQSFLDSQVTRCTAPAGAMPCLKNYVQTTIAKPADAYCAGFGVHDMTAAQIIEGVQRSCGISAKVLLVLLQKEQGLVTNTAPSEGRYRAATGYACPDTAACDSAYYGFFNQVYSAARQFQRYRFNASSFRYRAGSTVYIQWHPNAGCGGSNVYIQNAATAGLYNYTPYQPNGAALANLYGTGDGCSSYGNRNFFRIYSDWFGSLEGYSISGGIGEYYVARGGADGSGLGPPAGNQYVIDAGTPGWVQYFRSGQIYWSPSTGARTTSGGIGIHYTDRGGPAGTQLGYPTSEQYQLGDPANGWAQEFQNGRIYWTPATGAAIVLGLEFVSRGGPLSSGLGYPVADAYAVGSGSVQRFQAGSLLTASGRPTRVLTGAIDAYFWEHGGPVGSRLGFPTADASVVGGGVTQSFDNGVVYAASGGGVFVVPGGIGIDYVRLGGAEGALGYPVGAQAQLTSTGWMQPFQNGIIYWEASTGSRVVSGTVAAVFQGAGGPIGSGLGYPTGDQVVTNGVLSQSFQFGRIDGSTISISSPARAQYYANGGAAGPLGAITSARTEIGDPAQGWYDTYANGRVYGTVALAPHRVSGGIGLLYLALGGPTNSQLGYPISEQAQLLDAQGGWTQRFETGTIYWSPVTGAVALTGDIAAAVAAAGGASTAGLGYPIRAAAAVTGGVVQRFQYGAVVSSVATGVDIVPGGIGIEYLRTGGPSSLGFPTGSQYSANGGWAQNFEAGSIYFTAAGPFRSTGAIGRAYEKWGGPVGSTLGYPVENIVGLGGGSVQVFQHGRIYLTDTAAVIRTSGGIGQSYVSAGGNQYSGLGYPVTPQVRAADGGWSQNFQFGRIYWTPAYGAHFTAGGIGAHFAKAGGPSGSGLGYPTTGQLNLGNGNWVQYFQRGRIDWTAVSGARIVL